MMMGRRQRSTDVSLTTTVSVHTNVANQTLTTTHVDQQRWHDTRRSHTY